jgi:hypothetical protein
MDYEPDTRIGVFDVLFYRLRVRACPVFEDNGLQLGCVRIGPSIVRRYNRFASDCDNRCDGMVTEGLTDDLPANESGGTRHY